MAVCFTTPVCPCLEKVVSRFRLVIPGEKAGGAWLERRSVGMQKAGSPAQHLVLRKPGICKFMSGLCALHTGMGQTVTPLPVTGGVAAGAH